MLSYFASVTEFTDEKNIEAMKDFREEWETGSYITSVTINEYCRKMSRNVTEKTI